jgi:tight adherence protein C
MLPKRKNKSTKNEIIEKQLRLSGIYMTVPEFSFIKNSVSAFIFFVFATSAIIINIDEALKFLIFIFGLILSFLLPNYYIKSKIKGRQQKIREQLPEVLDLLCVCIEAGLGFDSSIMKISENLSGPFVDELIILQREIHMGRPRREALKNLGECSNITELKTFASSLSQAEELGISINSVLKVQSSQLRMTRKQTAQEKGMKAPVKMMLPMLIFIFPVIFIILLGPTVIQLIGGL